MRSTRALAVAALAIAAALAADGPMSRGRDLFPPLSELPRTPLVLQDVAFASAGFRAVGADVAWTQLLQYAAGSLAAVKEERPESYTRLKEMALRVTRLDPTFHAAYLFAASMLGWFPMVDRPDEALELLEEGQRRDPTEKRYAVYIAALAYQKKGDVPRMIALLESLLGDPRTPNVMRAILANLYMARGDYGRALVVWQSVLDNELDQTEHTRARQEMVQLRKLIRGR